MTYCFHISCDIRNKKGRGLLDLSLLSDSWIFLLETAVPLSSKIPTTTKSSATRAGGLWFGFVDGQRAAAELRGV